jgi:uncharacterized membrane protein YdjX (TVP38/TMEM64 family)
VSRGLVLLLLLVAALGTLAGLGLGPEVRDGVGHLLTLLAAGDREGLRAYLRGFGLWAPLVSAGLVQLQALVAPLPSFPLTYANGLLFGTWWGGVLSWTSILLSALLCFGLARLFGRPLVERFVSPAALAWADRHVAGYGAFAIFLGRLIPFTSFDLLSYAAGLTPMRVGPFVLATGLGMTPWIFLTAAFADAGWRSPWALLGGALGIAILAGAAALLRPSVARWLSRTPAAAGPADRTVSRAARSTPPAADAGTAASGGPAISRRAG